MPDDHNFNYRALTISDLEPMAQILAQSFEEDPLVAYILPNRRTRVKTVAKFFRAMGRINIRNNLAFGVSEPLEGVAIWNFPNQQKISATLKDLLTFMPLLLSSYPFGAQRARALFQQNEAMHKKYASEPHFYLDNIGVLSSARGLGLASKLIRPFLEMADTQKVTVYTETVTPANVPLYEHFGFQCVEASYIPGMGITLFALRRPVP